MFLLCILSALVSHKLSLRSVPMKISLAFLLSPCVILFAHFIILDLGFLKLLGEEHVLLSYSPCYFLQFFVPCLSQWTCFDLRQLQTFFFQRPSSDS